MTDLEKRINRWQREMWPGDRTPLDKIGKFDEEWHELLVALGAFERDPNQETRKALADEAADVAIVLTEMLGLAGLSLVRSMELKFADNLERSRGNGKPIDGGVKPRHLTPDPMAPAKQEKAKVSCSECYKYRPSVPFPPIEMDFQCQSCKAEWRLRDTGVGGWAWVQTLHAKV